MQRHTKSSGSLPLRAMKKAFKIAAKFALLTVDQTASSHARIVLIDAAGKAYRLRGVGGNVEPEFRVESLKKHAGVLWMDANEDVYLIESADLLNYARKAFFSAQPKLLGRECFNVNTAKLRILGRKIDPATFNGL